MQPLLEISTAIPAKIAAMRQMGFEPLAATLPPSVQGAKAGLLTEPKTRASTPPWLSVGCLVTDLQHCGYVIRLLCGSAPNQFRSWIETHTIRASLVLFQPSRCFEINNDRHTVLIPLNQTQLLAVTLPVHGYWNRAQNSSMISRARVHARARKAVSVRSRSSAVLHLLDSIVLLVSLPLFLSAGLRPVL